MVNYPTSSPLNLFIFETKHTIIFTARLKLRLLNREDLDDIFNYANDPAVAFNTSWSAHKTKADTEQFIAYVLSKDSHIQGQIRHIWSIQLKNVPTTIGTISFIQDNEQEGHIDYALGRPHWNQGITSEGVKGVIKWAFDHIPTLEGIHSGCLSRNIGSVKVLQKAGFQITEKYSSIRGGKFGNQSLETTTFHLDRQLWQQLGRNV